MTTGATELTLLELAEATGAKPRSLRYWISLGLLPSPRLRGSRTTYGADHLAHARAVVRLREQGLGFGEIRRRLVKASSDELARLGAPHPVPLDAPPPPPSPPTYPAERWERVVLMPGLELAVRADAAPVLRRIAQDIYSHYGGLAGGV